MKLAIEYSVSNLAQWIIGATKSMKQVSTNKEIKMKNKEALQKHHSLLVLVSMYIRNLEIKKWLKTFQNLAFLYKTFKRSCKATANHCCIKKPYLSLPFCSIYFKEQPRSKSRSTWPCWFWMGSSKRLFGSQYERWSSSTNRTNRIKHVFLQNLMSDRPMYMS